MYKIWLTVFVCGILGLAIGSTLENMWVGLIYGIIVGVAVGLVLDRKIRQKPPVG